MTVRREVTTFRRDAVADAGRLTEALNAFSQAVSARLAAVEGLGRIAVLDEIEFRTGASVGVNIAPFPMQVQTPFSVAGAWIAMLDASDAALGLAAVVPWVRPVSGGPDGEASALEIVNVTGLAVNTTYRLRLAVVGVRNG